jgi:hypothetical protein
MYIKEIKEMKDVAGPFDPDCRGQFFFKKTWF